MKATRSPIRPAPDPIKHAQFLGRTVKQTAGCSSIYLYRGFHSRVTEPLIRANLSRILRSGVTLLLRFTVVAVCSGCTNPATTREARCVSLSESVDTTGKVIIVGNGGNFLTASGDGSLWGQTMKLGELESAVELTNGEVVAARTSGGLVLLSPSHPQLDVDVGNQYTWLSLSPDRKRFLARTKSGRVRLFDSTSFLREIFTNDPTTAVGWMSNDAVVLSSKTAVHAYAIGTGQTQRVSKRGYRFVASGITSALAFDGTAILEIQNGQTRSVVTPNRFRVSTATSLEDGSFAVATSEGVTYRLSASGDWSEIDRSWTAALRMQYAAGYLAMGTSHGELRVLDLETGRILRSVGFRTNQNTSAIWINDTHSIAIGYAPQRDDPRTTAFFGELLDTSNACQKSPGREKFRKLIGG